MNAPLSLNELETDAPVQSLLALICSPEGGSVDCSDVLVVVAHPDDETIAIGGQLSRMKGVRLLHVTDGAAENMADASALGFASREDYAKARRKELEAAMEVVGIGSERLLSLGAADQSAAHRMAELALLMVQLLHMQGIGAVLTHAYEGGHPDHDATSFIVRAARHLMERSKRPAPLVFEFPLYHAREGRMVFQEFAPGEGVDYVIALDEEPAAAKRLMLKAFETQKRTLGTFEPKAERFRPAPRYDFHLPPNGGDFYYAQFDWGTSPSEWPRLVDEASRELDLPRWL